MRNHLLLLLVMVVAVSCGRRTVTGKGSVETVRKELPGAFSSIIIDAPLTANIHVVPDAPVSLSFTGYPNLVEELRVSVEQETLTISGRTSVVFDTDAAIIADITVPSAKALDIRGLAESKLDGDIKGNDFRLGISGAGDVTIQQIHVRRLEAKISGAGDVHLLSGAVDETEYRVSGAGSIRSFGVEAKKVTAKVSGAGDIDVFASETLDAKVSGAGTIRYKGSAQVKSKTSGVGSVVAVN